MRRFVISPRPSRAWRAVFPWLLIGSAAWGQDAVLPPPPPPPPPVRVPGPAVAAPEFIASSQGDSVRFEPRRSVLAVAFDAQPVGASGPRRLLAAPDGGQRTTAPSSRPHGETRVAPVPNGDARSLAAERRPAVFFSVASTRQVGVLAIPESLPEYAGEDEGALAALFRERAQYRSCRLSSRSLTAFAIPHDWYRRAVLELPDTTTSFRLVFFAYGEPGSARPTASMALVTGPRLVASMTPSTGVSLDASGEIATLGSVRLVTGGGVEKIGEARR